MDTITHTLFGYTLYKIANKGDLPKKHQSAFLFSALVGSQIPDIDVVAEFTEAGQINSQMWHRGLTHSIFLVPFWAGLIYMVARFLFRTKNIKLFYLALLAVFWHDTIDLFNAWGTGYFEPFSSMRITIGTIPIVDLVFWSLFLIGFVVSRINKKIPSHLVFRFVAIGILTHFAIQTTQGLMIERQAMNHYQQTELSATFVPWKFRVIGKNHHQIDIYEDTLFTKKKHIQTVYSKEEADLTPLFKKNPKAKVLYEWSPFVVVVDNHKELKIFDPRFLEEGESESFLSESIQK